MQPTEKQPKQVEDREPLPESHPAFLQELKQRIRESQVRVFLSVNRELVMLYWRIGRDILIRQKRENWGAKIIDRLVADLKKVFPEMKGFSPRNLKYMRAWRKRNLCNRLLHKFPWGHNVRILDCLKDRSAREWYVKATVEHGWSRNVIVHQIESGAHKRAGAALRTLSERFHLRNPISLSRSQRTLTHSTSSSLVRMFMSESSNGACSRTSEISC